MEESVVNTPREAALREFLARCGQERAERLPIPGDASFRRYERLRTGEGASLILMDAPPEHEDVRPFLRVQSCLRRAGYSVPEVLGEDAEEGFLLLEDLGDDSFSRLLAARPEEEEALYCAAAEVLAGLWEQGTAVARSAPPEPYSPALLEREAGLLTQWFLPLLMEPPRAEAAGAAFMERLRTLFSASDLTPQVLVHRDYHADNLLWLATREPVPRKVGMLDFQDAVLGRAAYDLVSLLEDARRDIAPCVAAAARARYLRRTGVNAEEFLREYALYGAQRNAKILGIFARLCLRDGKPRYLEMMPRVWAHFLNDLSHPALASLKAWSEEFLGEEERALITAEALAARAERR
jgi:aminoglycoside/choline kinase family phosphotransferase